MRGLFGDVVASGVVWKLPVAGICLAQDWIERLLDASIEFQSVSCYEAIPDLELTVA